MRELEYSTCMTYDRVLSLILYLGDEPRIVTPLFRHAGLCERVRGINDPAFEPNIPQSKCSEYLHMELLYNLKYINITTN